MHGGGACSKSKAMSDGTGRDEGFGGQFLRGGSVCSSPVPESIMSEEKIEPSECRVDETVCVQKCPDLVSPELHLAELKVLASNTPVHC